MYERRTHESNVYEGNVYEGSHAGRRSNRREWWVVAAGLAALLVVLILIGVACNAAADRADPPVGGLGTAGPSGTAEPAPPGGIGDDNGGGGEQPPAPPPQQPPPPPPPPEPSSQPEPLSIEATVFSPPVQPTCHATGRIAVAGGDYDLTVTYQWFRSPHPLQGVVVAFGEEQEATLSEPGTIDVTSPPFPESTDKNQVQLRVLGPATATSNVVTYPTCAELGFG